jgi:hypothetical protein
MNKSRQISLVSICVLAIAGSAAAIWYNQFARPSTATLLHQGVGTIMAEETARILDGSGKIVLLTIDESQAPELKVQIQSFKKRLAGFPKISIEKVRVLETEGQKKYRAGAGLSGRRFVRIVKKDSHADAVVSFVGVPELTEAEVAEIGKPVKFIAEVRAAEKLKPLFDKKLIDVAVVSRFEFPAPGTKKPKTSREWFDNRFQVISAVNASSLP